MEEKELNDEIVSDKLTFKLENFSGPLDLLLTLIKKSKLEIDDVEISKLTEQYLEVMNDITTVDMEVACEFIELRAKNYYLKLKKILKMNSILNIS